MLHILMGEAKTGKSYRVYNEIIEQIHAGNAHRCLLIVPEQFTLEAEKLLLTQGSLDGVVGLEILSLKRLAHYVFNQLGKPKETEITRLGQMMLLKEIFESEKQQLVYYKRAFDKRGMLEKCFELIEELKQNRIEPEMMRTAVDVFKSAPILTAKLKDITLIYETYEQAKSNLYLDSADLYEALLNKLPNATSISQKKIWIDGFDSFSIQELAIIESLCKLSPEVTLTLTGTRDRQNERFAHTVNVYDKITKFEDVPYEVEYLDKVLMPSDLRHLSLHAMTYPLSVWHAEVEGIELFEAQSTISEVEWMAREILKVMRSGNYAWRDFSVLTNDLERYRMLIVRVFDRHGIPYFMDEKRTILNNPVVHFLMNLFEALQQNFRQDTVVKLLKTGFYDVEDLQVAYFENFIIENGIYGRKLFKPFQSEMISPERLALIEALRIQFTEPLNQYSSDIKEASNVREQLKVLYDVMLKMSIPSKIQAEVERFAQEGNFEQSQLFAQIWNAVMDVFDQLASLLGDRKMTANALWERIQVGLEQCEIGLLPLTPQHVFIGSLDRSRTHAVKISFIMGINDGVLPEGGSDQQLLLEQEKQLMLGTGLRWLSDQKMFLQKESFNIYQALTRPSEKLMLSFAYSDSKGNALRPSYLVPKFKQVLPKLRVQREAYGHLKHIENISTPYGTLVDLASQLRLHLDGQEIDSIWFEVIRWYRENMPELAEKIMNASEHHYHVEKLAESEVKNLYELPLKSSVSGLEQFVQCPFKFFVSQGLRPKRVKPYEINYPDVGILFHSALERFGKSIIEKDLAWEKLSKEQCEMLVEEIIGHMVSAEVYQSKFQYKALIRKLNRVAKRAIWTLTQHLQLGKFTPKAFELAFSDSGLGVPPIVFKLEGGETMLLRGVVDRIDLLETNGEQFIKIIDYKSGSRTLSLQEIYQGLQIQLSVYMYACLLNPSYFRAATLQPAGMYYYRIDDPILESTDQNLEIIENQILGALKLDGLTLDDPMVLEALDFGIVDADASSIVQVRRKKDGTFTKDSKILNKDQFQMLLEHVVETVKEVGSGIVSGDISIAPCKTQSGLSCNYCEYGSICQFDSTRDFSAVRAMPKISSDDVVEKINQKIEEKTNVDA